MFYDYTCLERPILLPCVHKLRNPRYVVSFQLFSYQPSIVALKSSPVCLPAFFASRSILRNEHCTHRDGGIPFPLIVSIVWVSFLFFRTIPTSLACFSNPPSKKPPRTSFVPHRTSGTNTAFSFQPSAFLQSFLHTRLPSSRNLHITPSATPTIPYQLSPYQLSPFPCPGCRGRFESFSHSPILHLSYYYNHPIVSQLVSGKNGGLACLSSQNHLQRDPLWANEKLGR